MAGEIEEPIMIDFKADSLHSGSISFGRFESEVLCWERRSSFCQNRYLEEVEKCSKPGLVTEKKAYFEAHFRKKGIPCLGSPEAESQNDDNDPSEKTGYYEENSHLNVGMHSPQYDESPDGSTLGSEHQVMERGIELSCDGINNVDIISDPGTVEEAHDPVILESVVPTHSRSEIEVKEGLDDTNVKERIPSQAQHMKTRLVRGVSAAQSLRCISRKEASKGSEKNPSKTVHNVLMRSKAEKKTSQTSAQDKCPMQKTSKDEPGSKGKGVNVIRRGDKESRNRGIEAAHPTTLRKLPSRVRQSDNRIRPAVGVNQACIKQDSSRFSFKCNERAETRKEEKADAEIKQMRKSLNFKAKPLPSFYRCEPDRNKVLKQFIAPTNEPRKLQTNSSRTGSRVSDPPQASGATSCHSTVTSDSTPSSPASEISKGHDLSRAVVNSRVGVKKEKDKLTWLPKHKAPKDNKATYKGKMMDGKQKNRTEVAKSTLQTRIVQR